MEIINQDENIESSSAIVFELNDEIVFDTALATCQTSVVHI